MGVALRVLRTAWRLLFGAVLCQSLVGAVLVVGWSMEVVRIEIERWLRPHAERRSGAKLRADWPGFFVPAGGMRPFFVELRQRHGVRRKASHLLRPTLHHLRLGLLGVGATWLLTLPAGTLWSLSWHAGWNNSFAKGYEDAATGPLVGLLGLSLFALAMLYVPTAQARQAACGGGWRPFFAVATVLRLVGRRPLAHLLLAAAYGLASLPVNLGKTAPVFFPILRPVTLEMPAAELLAMIDAYFYWTALPALLLFVALRLVAGRIYAGALLLRYREGALELSELEPAERQLLGGSPVGAPPPRRRVRRALRAAVAGGLLAAAAALWVTVAAQTYVAEFFAYHGPRGWLQQPLIQAPWVRWVPEALEKAARVEP